MTAGAGDDFRKPLDEEPVLRRWADAAMRRNYQNLVDGNFDGGPELAHNQKYTVRRKGFDKPGFGKTGEMSINLVNVGNVTMWVGGEAARAEVAAGPGATDMKINLFVRGQVQPKRAVILTGKKGQPRKREEREVRVPARDFLQVDQRELDDSGGEAVDAVLRAWGFK